MKQIIPKVHQVIGFGEDGPALTGVNDGDASGFVSTFSITNRIPNPNAATYRNLILFSRDPARTVSVTCRIVKNGADTPLVVTLPVGQQVAFITGVDVNFSQYEDIAYKWTLSGALPFPGCVVSTFIEREGNSSFHGITAGSGSPPLTEGYIGGAFGNGKFETWNGQMASNTRSICGTPGSVVGFVMKSHMGNVGPGATFVARAILGGILQDGSPGTINTSVTITEGNSQAFGSFNLPVLKGQRCDVLVRRTGVAGNGGGQVAVGILFEPTIAGRFMLCGGSNASVPAASNIYRWVESPNSSELYGQAPIGLDIILAHGMYICRGIRAEPGGGPGFGQSITHTLMKGSTLDTNPVALTACSVTISDLTAEGLIEGLNIQFEASSTATLGVFPTAGASSAALYWGLEASVFEPPPTGTLIVQKSVSGIVDNDTEFSVNVGGGLTPSSLLLQHGESQLYSDVLVGTYSVSETPPSGWTVSITVSNGSPSNAITVGDGETVIVSIVNLKSPTTASGIYKLVPGKLNDTLWVDVNAGTTRNVKKPNPFIKTGLIGE